MAADRDSLSAADLVALQGRVTHHLVEEIPGPEHISDDGLTGLCGESLIVAQSSGPVCPACRERAASPRWTWPWIGPAALMLVWVTGTFLGREMFVAGLARPARTLVWAAATAALYGVIALAGRVRPTVQGGDQQS